MRNKNLPFKVIEVRDIKFVEKDIIQIKKLSDMIQLSLSTGFRDGFLLGDTLYLIGSEVAYSCALSNKEYKEVI